MAFAWMILIAHRFLKGEFILVKLTPMGAPVRSGIGQAHTIHLDFQITIDLIFNST
jgi:hypothetical protein